MTSSYQHSIPGHLHVELASADENDPLYSNERRRPTTWTTARNKRLAGVMIVGLVVMAAGLASHLGSTPTTTTLMAEADSMPDYNSDEGKYDWKKCMDSKDPDCWKNEGKRVGGWWSNFGQRMSNFWKSLFGKKSSEDEDQTTATEEPVKEPKDEVTEETPKKKSKERKAPKKEPKAPKEEPETPTEEPETPTEEPETTTEEPETPTEEPEAPKEEPEAPKEEPKEKPAA